MAKQATKQLGTKAIKSLNIGFYGNEPVFNGIVTRSELLDALNWYNYNLEKKEGINFLYQYLKNNNRAKEASNVKAAGEKYIPFTSMKIARMLSTGAILPDDTMSRFETSITEGIRKYLLIKKAEPEQSTYTPIKKLNEYYVSIAIPIEEAIESLDPNFNVAEYYVKSNVNDALIKKIIRHYDNDILSYKKINASAQILYIQNVIDSSKAFLIKDKIKVAKPRVVRKIIRAKKLVPAIKKIATLKFAKEFADFNLKSIDPISIIGAQSLWVYDIKNAKLTNFKAKNENGLDVKGTSVINYNESTSQSKRAGKKAKDIVPPIVSYGKVQLRKVFSDIKTANINVSGRLGENVILLKTEK